MYFLKTGSPEYLRWLRTFEPLMVITGIVTPLATIPSISKLYFTHSQHASGQSLTTWSIFALASLLWLVYGLLNRKAAIYVGNIIALIMNLLMVNGILMHAVVDLLSVRSCHQQSRRREWRFRICLEGLKARRSTPNS